MDTNKCLICHHNVPASYFLEQYEICRNCFKKMPLIYKNEKILGYPCLILYQYNDFIEEIILRIKGYGDKKLCNVFLNPIKDYLKLKYFSYVCLPIPSSKSSDNKRGFNHVKEMIKPLGLEVLDCFSKKENHKQAYQSKFGRTKIDQIIGLNPSKLSRHKNYLIVDDITTTHQSIKTCIKLLEQASIKRIKILVFASSCRTKSIEKTQYLSAK